MMVQLNVGKEFSRLVRTDNVCMNRQINFGQVYEWLHDPFMIEALASWSYVGLGPFPRSLHDSKVAYSIIDSHLKLNSNII